VWWGYDRKSAIQVCPTKLYYLHYHRKIKNEKNNTVVLSQMFFFNGTEKLKIMYFWLNTYLNKLEYLL